MFFSTLFPGIGYRLIFQFTFESRPTKRLCFFWAFVEIKCVLCVFNWVWMKEKLGLQVWICKYLGSHCFVLGARVWVCMGPNKAVNGKVRVSSVTSESIQVFILKKKTSCLSVSQWRQSSLSENYLASPTAACDFYPRNFLPASVAGEFSAYSFYFHVSEVEILPCFLHGMGAGFVT